MVNKTLLYGVVGFLLGGIVVSTAFALTDKNTEQAAQSGGHSQTADALQGKTGDEFDKAFLDEMIVHHEGAVHMAEDAKVDAKHQEIKDMADAIIETQTKEIEQMKQWQREWGYE